LNIIGWRKNKDKESETKENDNSLEYAYLLEKDEEIAMLKAKHMADEIEIAYLKEQLSDRRIKVLDEGDNFCKLSCFDDENLGD
jgi:hypothetical protein